MSSRQPALGAPPDVSVVLPVYRSEAFVAERVGVLLGHLDRGPYSFEVLAVDDGSPDTSAAILESVGHPALRVLRRPRNGGKFAAVKDGMAVARGRCRVFTDADVPYELDALDEMVHHVLDRGFHLAVGDRTLPGSSYAAELGLVRRVTTQAFTLFVRLFVTSGLADTQCGLKAFRADVARALFPVLAEDRFAGDVEILYVALLHALEVKRVPVRLAFQGDSTVRPRTDAARMLAALARIRRRRRRGAYDTPALRALAG